VRRLLVALAMPRMSRSRPTTVPRGTAARSAAAFVAPLLAVASPVSTCGAAQPALPPVQGS